MKLPITHDRRPIGANMTPMIDVVFLLIIFFLVSSHLARRESRLPLELASANSASMQDPETSPLTISVDPQSRIAVRGANVDQNRLAQLIKQHVADKGTSAAIRIRSHRFATYRIVEPILQAAAESGVTDISLAVVERGSR